MAFPPRERLAPRWNSGCVDNAAIDHPFEGFRARLPGQIDGERLRDGHQAFLPCEHLRGAHAIDGLEDEARDPGR